MEGEFVVKVEAIEDDGFRPLGVVSAIWSELSGGVGPWGAIRPLFAVVLSLVPFLFLGQHFNRQHRKGGGVVSNSVSTNCGVSVALSFRVVDSRCLVGFQWHCSIFRVDE